MNYFRYALSNLLAILSISGYAQNNNQYIPYIIPPSPYAASLLKFSDIPVSPYTGTSDVNIPIYTIQAKGLTIPVSLDYHTGGIKLKEEAGWVGLGWGLSAGGAISRTILDKDDFDGMYFDTPISQLPGDISSVQPIQTSNPPDLGKYMFDFYCNSKVNTSAGTEDFYNAFVTVNNLYDLEPDVYSFNFPGNSGKFIITKGRKVILQKQSNIKVTFESTGNSFTIKDDEGNSFYFADKEYTQAATGALHQAISTWNLSQIVTQQNDTVNFSYATDNSWTYVAPEYYDTYNAFCSATAGFFHGNGAGTIYLNKTLQNIDFANGQLQFSFDNVRDDLQGGKKLNAVKLYAKSPASGSLNYLKEFDLSYSYFYNTITTDVLENKRLRLDMVTEVSGSVSLAPYVFTYNGTVGTASQAKHGYSIDNWGYYNNRGNTTYIPTTSLYYNPPNFGNSPPSLFTFTGANRDPDNSAGSTQIFSLQQVKYPTGGKTVFEYEANDYDYHSSIIGPQDFPQVTLVHNQTIWSISNRGQTNGSLDVSGISPAVAPPQQTQNATLIVTFRSSGNDCNVHYSNTYGKIYLYFNGTHYDISTSGVTCAPNSPVSSITVPLTFNAGGSMIVNWTGYIDPTVAGDFQEIRVQLNWDQVQAVSTNNPNFSPTITAGGLRIKSITDYADDSKIAKKRSYTYNYDSVENGNIVKCSYGKLMSYCSYARYVTGPSQYPDGSCNGLRLEGSSNTSLNSVIQGNTVGYNQVTEATIDPITNIDIGKTVYTYYNTPDTVLSCNGFRFPGAFNIGSSLNGSLLSKTVFVNNEDGSYNPVSASVNTYQTANRIIYFSPKYDYTGKTSNVNLCIAPPFATQQEVIACFYPSIKSERVLLTNTDEYFYDKTDASKFVKNTINYFYNNPIHYQLTSSSSPDSKGNLRVTAQRYPQDFLPNGAALTNNTIIDGMINRNMVAAPIEKKESIFYGGVGTEAVVGAQLNNYRILTGGAIGIDKQFKFDI